MPKVFGGSSLLAAAEQMWHTQDSHGQILALTSRLNFLKTFRVVPFSLGSDRRCSGPPFYPARSYMAVYGFRTYLRPMVAHPFVAHPFEPKTLPLEPLRSRLHVLTWGCMFSTSIYGP